MQKATNDSTKDFFNRVKYDIRYWNEVVFGDFELPWDRQWDIWESVVKYRKTVCRAGKGVGKSHIAGGRIVPWFLTTFYPSVVFTTAPTGRQVERVLWGEIRRHWKRAKVDLGGRVYEGKPLLFIDDDWYAMGFTTRKRVQGEDIGSLFQGFHSLHVLFIIDEAAAVEPDVWDMAEAVCTTEHSRILAIGNPTDANSEFAKKFKSPAPEDPGGWNKIKISVLDSPNLTAGRTVIPKLTSAEWVEDKKVSWGMGTPMWQANIEAEFPEMGIDTLIPLPFIEKALEKYRQWKSGTAEEREEIENLTKYRKKHLGVDTAREGDDLCVGYKLEGTIAERLFRLPKSKTDETVSRVGRAITDEHYDVVNIEQDPYGAAIIDMIRAQGHQVNGILPGGTANEPQKYFHKKTELAFKLRERFIEAEDIALDCEDTGGQLANYKYIYTTKAGYDVYRLEPKKDMKKRIGRSPDDGDALIFANANIGIGRGQIATAPSIAAQADW